jgi:hypothetical protein
MKDFEKFKKRYDFELKIAEKDITNDFLRGAFGEFIIPYEKLKDYVGKYVIYFYNERTYNKKIFLVEGFNNDTGVINLAGIDGAKWTTEKLEFLSATRIVENFPNFLEHIFNKDSLEFVKNNFVVKQFEKQPKTEETKMMNTNIQNYVDDNADAAKGAASVVAGKAINKAVLEQLKGSLPLMVRGYADTAIGRVIVANLINFAAKNFMEGNSKAEWVADAVMLAAMTEVLESFDIEKMFNEVLDKVNVKVPVE